MQSSHSPPPDRKISCREYVLAALALQGPDATLTPVQVQKLFFILDKEIPALTGGPYFNFKPYDYGPFDPEVYREIELLQFGSLAVIQSRGKSRTYMLSTDGIREGLNFASKLPQPAQAYIKRVGEFVRRLSFSKLVSSIYKQYPEMKANSVFLQ